MDFDFGALIDSHTIKAFLGDTASQEFLKTLVVFAAAAYVHARQVRKEIKDQIGALIEVLKADLEGQKYLLGKLDSRVGKLEEKLQVKP